jgi:uncharacterized membrane protein
MNKQNSTNKSTWLDQWYPKILLVSSLFALVASFWQAAERIHMLKNPTVPLNCNLNPIIDCGGVMSHRLAALFGFPNTFIGMVMFSMLLASALVLLSGSSFKKSFHKFVLALSTIAIGFSAWFFWASLYVIGKICIFCLAIWPASIILFWYGLLYWFSKQDQLSAGRKKFYKFGMRNHWFVVFCVFLLMLTLFLLRFRDYYFG